MKQFRKVPCGLIVTFRKHSEFKNICSKKDQGIDFHRLFD